MKAIFDYDINYTLDGEEFKEFYPKLYYLGQKSRVFNIFNYLFWVFTGLIHSLIIFVLPYYCITESNILTQDGLNGDLTSLSITCFTAVIIVVDIKITMVTRVFNHFHWVCTIILSFAAYYAVMWFLHAFNFDFTYQSAVALH